MLATPRRSCSIAMAGILLWSVPAQSQDGVPIAAKPAPNQSAKLPKISVLCLAPGSRRPMPCAAGRKASDIELLATGSMADAPPILIFRQLGGSGRQAKVQVKWFLDQSMSTKRARIPVSSQLCPAASQGQQIQFEIQVATSDMNQAQSGQADSVGFFQMRC